SDPWANFIEGKIYRIELCQTPDTKRFFQLNKKNNELKIFALDAGLEPSLQKILIQHVIIDGNTLRDKSILVLYLGWIEGFPKVLYDGKIYKFGNIAACKAIQVLD